MCCLGGNWPIDCGLFCGTQSQATSSLSSQCWMRVAAPANITLPWPVIAALQVLARAGGRYSMVQVREAVDALQNEGHLYSTIDENHFKVGLG